MNIADVLSGSAGLEGIQWMFTGAPHRALRRELAAMLRSPRLLGSCRLRLARFKPGRKLRGFYDAHIRVAEGAGGVRPIVVTWKAKGKGEPPSQELADLEAEAQRRGLLAPFRKLAAHSSASGMQIEVSPLDREFPQLVRLCDSQYVRDMLARTGARATGARHSVAFVRYRPGQRHVLRYDPVDGPDRGAIFGKIYGANIDGERVFRLAQRVKAWLESRGGGVASVRPLAYMAHDSMGLYAQVSGTPLPECLRHPSENLTAALRQTGATLYALHQLPPGITGPLEFHDFRLDAEKIARTSELAGEHIPALLPSAGSALQRLLGRARELYEHLPLEPATFTYGDFKAEHVWIGPGGLTLIDFDSCRQGDPALDVGKFLADLRFWCAVHGRHDAQQARDLFLAGYGPGAPVERLLRARLYEATELVKLSVRRIGLMEPDWAKKIERLIGCAQTVLNDLERGLGRSKMAGKRVSHAHR